MGTEDTGNRKFRAGVTQLLKVEHLPVFTLSVLWMCSQATGHSKPTPQMIICPPPNSFMNSLRSKGRSLSTVSYLFYFPDIRGRFTPKPGKCHFQSTFFTWAPCKVLGRVLRGESFGK